MVEAESVELEVIPAQYDWVEEKVLISPASVKIEEIPAEHKWEEQRVLIKPAHTIWKKGRGPIERVDGARRHVIIRGADDVSVGLIVQLLHPIQRAGVRRTSIRVPVTLAGR